MLYKMRYILWVGALLRPCDVIQDGGHIGRHILEMMKNFYYHNFRNYEKTAETEFVMLVM